MLLSRKHVSLVIITILLILCLTTSGCMFTEVTDPFSVDPEDQYGFQIPQGSVIYHWANGITEVYGPDNNRMLIAKDSMVNYAHPTPPNYPGTSGQPRSPSPTTHGYQVPNGSRIEPDDDGTITRVYQGDTLILTIIEKSEEFPLISLGKFYIPLP